MSGTVLQIRDNGQITLPTSIAEKQPTEIRDLLEVSIESDGSIRLTPKCDRSFPGLLLDQALAGR